MFVELRILASFSLRTVAVLGLTFRNFLTAGECLKGSCEFCVYELYEFLSFEGLVAGQWGWFKSRSWRQN